MKIIIQLFAGLIMSLVLVSCWSIKREKAIGNLLINRIEQYKTNTNHLPDMIYGRASKNDFWNLPIDRIDSLVAEKQVSVFMISGQELWYVKDTITTGISVFEINGTVFCYEKKDSINYSIWFGTVLGESIIYDSDTKQWVDTCKPER